MGKVSVEVSVGYLERLMRLPEGVEIIGVRYEAVAQRVTFLLSGPEVLEAPEGKVARPVVIDDVLVDGRRMA